MPCNAVLLIPQGLWSTSTHLQVFKRNGCSAVLTWHRTFGTLIVDMPLLTGSRVLHSTAMFTADNNIGTLFSLVLLSIEDKIINFDVINLLFFHNFSNATILYKSYQVSGNSLLLAWMIHKILSVFILGLTSICFSDPLHLHGVGWVGQSTSRESISFWQPRSILT